MTKKRQPQQIKQFAIRQKYYAFWISYCFLYTHTQQQFDGAGFKIHLSFGGFFFVRSFSAYHIRYFFFFLFFIPFYYYLTEIVSFFLANNKQKKKGKRRRWWQVEICRRSFCVEKPVHMVWIRRKFHTNTFAHSGTTHSNILLKNSEVFFFVFYFF